MGSLGDHMDDLSFLISDDDEYDAQTSLPPTPPNGRRGFSPANTGYGGKADARPPNPPQPNLASEKSPEPGAAAFQLRV